ncbi:MAG: 30S ribosomal protein S6 [Anaerolineales bacterium]|nr:MAG: 30S ribosomal protein S6 [Anaerolineales bacterium]
MRNYEIAFIADAELDPDAISELETKVKGWIEAAGGTPGKVDQWGKRRFAYPIQKKNEGYYTFIEAEMPAQAPASVERNMRLTEQILRFMVTSKEV